MEKVVKKILKPVEGYKEDLLDRAEGIFIPVRYHCEYCGCELDNKILLKTKKKGTIQMFDNVQDYRSRYVFWLYSKEDNGILARTGKRIYCYLCNHLVYEEGYGEYEEDKGFELKQLVVVKLKNKLVIKEVEEEKWQTKE